MPKKKKEDQTQTQTPKRTAGSYLRRKQAKLNELDEAFDFQEEPMSEEEKKRRKKNPNGMGYTLE